MASLGFLITDKKKYTNINQDVILSERMVGPEGQKFWSFQILLVQNGITKYCISTTIYILMKHVVVLVL